MEKRVQVMLTFCIAIFIILGLYFFTDWFSKVTGYLAGADEKAKLAQCLSKNGVEIYGTEYCADCEKQKEMFGKAFSQLSYTDCGRNMENCKNLKEIPAWYINGSFSYGLKNISELKVLSGC
jgi:hypothetical protein